MANARKVHRVTGVVQTTDAATQTTVVLYTVPTNSVVGIEASVVGKDGSNNLVYAKKVASATRSAGGAALVGSVLDLMAALTSVTLSTAVVTIDVSGNDVRVRVNGILATTIDWFSELTVWEV